jgi:hypothetical protein
MAKGSSKSSSISGLSAFPIDNAPVEATWSEALSIGEIGGKSRSKSRKRLAQSQVTRMQAEGEPITATKDYCVRAQAQADHLLEEADRALSKAERMKASASARAESMEEEIQFRLKDASDKRKNARAYAEQLESTARDAADALMNQTRTGAKELADRMRHTAAEDIRKILTDLEIAREAAEDELAAQQLFTETAQIKAGVAGFESVVTQGEPMTFASAPKKKVAKAKQSAVRTPAAKERPAPARATPKTTKTAVAGPAEEPDWGTLRKSKNYRDAVKAVKPKAMAKPKAKANASKSARKAA